MRKFLILMIIITAFIHPCFCAYATENDIQNDISDKLFDGFDKEVNEVLEDFGITSLDYEKIYNISVENIFMYYKDRFSDYLRGSVKLFSKVFAVIMIGGMVSLICDERKYKDILNIILIPVVVILLVDEINLCLNSALSLLKLNGNFLLSFVPIFAVTIAIAGNPGTALTYNTLVLGFGEVVSATLNFSLVDIIGCLLSISIGFSMNNNINFSRFLNAVNRFITFSLGILSSFFGAMLSVKGIFSASADSVASKGIRFAISSLIPVIGSAISDAYSTLLGSIGIIKNSVAVIGMIAILLINLPIVVEIIFLNITLNTLSFISEMLDCNGLTNLLKAFAFAVKIIGLLVVFEAFILIISTAIMLTVKGG